VEAFYQTAEDASKWPQGCVMDGLLNIAGCRARLSKSADRQSGNPSIHSSFYWGAGRHRNHGFHQAQAPFIPMPTTHAHPLRHPLLR